MTTNGFLRLSWDEGAPTRIGSAGIEAPLDPSDPGVQVLEVAGGFLVLDLGAGAPLPSAVVERVDVAQEWLGTVYGASVRDAVIRAAEAEGAGVETVLASVPDEVTGLMRGLWYRRWWPSPDATRVRLQEWLLDAELALLAFDTAELFGSTAPAIELLRSAAPGLLEHADRAEEPGRVGDVIRAAGRLLADLGIEAEPSSSSDDARSSPPRAPIPADAVWVEQEVDWRRVPPRAVAGASGALRWTVLSGVGAAEVHVDLAAAEEGPSRAEDESLLFRVRLPGDTVGGRLERDSAGYHGRVQLDPEDATDLAVSVFAREAGPTGPADAAAVRSTVLGVLERLREDPEIQRLAVELGSEGAVDGTDDLDLEWLILSDRARLYREAGSAAGARRLIAADPLGLFRVEVARTRAGWRVRIRSVGAEGAAALAVRHSDGHVDRAPIVLSSDAHVDHVLPARDGAEPDAVSVAFEV